jgi:MoaA/NifB/PqqE/SkfB family radical SAM enzyme
MKNELIKIAVKYPAISNRLHGFVKRLWYIKSHFINYNYPENKQLATVTKEQLIKYNQNRIYGPKKKFCYAAFNNIHFYTNGDISSCSYNENSKIGNIQKSTIREVWNSTLAEDFRNLMSKCNLSKCENCSNLIKMENYTSFPPIKYDYYSSDHSNYPTQMSFEISDLCNLECIMCNEELSSLIRKNKAKLPPLKNVYPDNFAEQLEEFIPHLKTATFIGGEPLLIKKYYEIWDRILKINPQCKIHIQTNATVIPDRFKKYLESGQFDMGVSIDAPTKETYEKIRVNGNFEDVIANIEYLKKLRDKGKLYLNFNFCPLVTNWKEIPDMIRFANKQKVILKILNIEGPMHLVLKHRDSTFLKNAYSYLKNAIPASKEQNIIVQRNFDSYNKLTEEFKHYIIFAENKEQFISELMKMSDITIENEFTNLLTREKTMQTFPEDEKVRIISGISDHIDTICKSTNLKKIVMIHHIYLSKNTQYKLKINVEASIYISMAKKHLNEIFLLLAADK